MSKVYTTLPIPETPEGLKHPEKLSDEHEEKRIEVLEHFSKEDYVLPEIEENGGLMEAEKFWLTNDCILRYLRATKWDAAHAIKRLEDTLKWRREFGFYDKLTPEYVEPEGLTGKEVIFGFDVDRRPGLYMFPSRQNTEESIRQIHFAIWMMERSLDFTGVGVESIALFINYADKSRAGPSLQTSRSVLSILQNHYPERLGRAFMINIPFLMNALLKIIWPFVDPVTREKVKFNPKVVDEGFIAPEMLMNAHGWPGAQEFVWDHEKYWPNLLEVCNKRREEQMDRWRTLGGKVGISEWDIKGGLKPAVTLPVDEKVPINEITATTQVEEVKA